MKTNILIYIAVILFSALFIFLGNYLVSDRSDTERTNASDDVSGMVYQIIERVETHQFGYDNILIRFYVRITDRERRGEIVETEQRLSGIALENMREVSVGSRVRLAYDASADRFFFVDHERLNSVIILTIIFFVLAVVLGKLKGFNALIALGFTCMAVFTVFIPAILAGRNIYIATIIVCTYTIVSTMLIVIGVNKKALSAMLGCLGGVLLAGGLMALMDFVLYLSGIHDENMMILNALHFETSLNFSAIIFAGIILGAVGAIMDVALSIASSLWELKTVGNVADFKSITKSGITIGKDVLGTMLNTLILAYIGSSLTLILLISSHPTNLSALLNTEMVVVEIIRALVGSFGMLLTIPLTSGLCGWIYTNDIKRDWLPQKTAENR